jgi:hypothetical protein
LDALVFSLSGLPAARAGTSAAAMAFVLEDMHKTGAALDYLVGGMGSIIVDALDYPVGGMSSIIVDALVDGVIQGDRNSKVQLRQIVVSIADMDCDSAGKRVKGITLTNGKVFRAHDGVICNAPVWSLKHLIKDERMLHIMNDGNKSVPTTDAASVMAASTPTPDMSTQGAAAAAAAAAAEESSNSEGTSLVALGPSRQDSTRERSTLTQ